MDRIELAERRYREIIPPALLHMHHADRYWKMPVSGIEAWIANYVLPAVEEVYQRPLFRQHVTWAQRSLKPESGTAERAGVQRVDKALVSEAESLCRIARIKRVARAMNQRSSGSGQEALLPIGLRPKQSPVVPASAAPVHSIDYAAHVARIAERPWTDLVCVDDFFEPVGGMMRKKPLPSGVTEGAMVVSLMPHLFLVGDSIIRCMMQRVRSWLTALAESRAFIYKALEARRQLYSKQLAAEHENWQELQQAWQALQLLCLSGPAFRLREACSGLVQVYTEYHPSPDLSWLGISDLLIQRFRGKLRFSIASQRDLETLDRIAAALGDLKFLYREMEPEERAIDEAIATGGLVLIKNRREVHWLGEKVAVDWQRYAMPWTMLLKLAMNARLGSPVGNFDLYQDGVSNSTIANRWRRLKELLPASLARSVVPGAERATYRLKLSVNQIHIF